MSRWVKCLTRKRTWIDYNAFHLRVKQSSANAIKHIPRTKCARGKIDEMEGREKKFLFLKVEDRDKIIIKIQLSETNFVTTIKQEGQQHNCLCIAGPKVRTGRFFIALSIQGECKALSESFLLNGTSCFVFCFLVLFVWAIIPYIIFNITGELLFSH